MTQYIGVDGCRAGWFAVALDDSDGWTLAVYPTISALWAAHRQAKRILIDVPIGLPEAAARTADAKARHLLKARRSSVFAVPVRAAIYASAYAEANERNRQAIKKGISKQLWNIAPKIREVDALVRQDPAARERLIEAHPELLFWGLSGQPMAHSKKNRLGLAERLAVLEEYFPPSRKLYAAAVADYPRRMLARDDVLDALAAAVAAGLSTLRTVPETPEFDAMGVPMRIAYAQPPRIVRLHHVQITIPPGQEDAARSFYCTLLGLCEVGKPKSMAGRGGFWLELGALHIHIGVEDPGVDRSATRAHIAYQVANLEEWRSTLKAHGIALIEPPPLPGFARVQFRDPFGNMIEFVQPT